MRGMRGVVRLALCLAGLALAAPTLPQESSAGLIEEIIVTAQRREENLQDTPISVTAFTADAIDALGFRRSLDITAQTPNFSVGYPGGENAVPALFIRGVGLNDFGVLNQGPIALYMDQTYISSNAAQVFQILDLERVEVLRGPQGTLYGRNATGGAVNFVSRKPTQEWDGWARAGYGSFDMTSLEGAFGGPLGDKTAFRAAAAKTHSDGWMKNDLTGNYGQGIDEMAWRLLLETRPTEELHLLLNVRGGKKKSDSMQYRHRALLDPATGDLCSASAARAGNCIDAFGYSEEADYTTPFTGIDVSAVPDYDEGNYDFEGKNDSNFWGASLTLDWTVGDYVITSITSYDDMEDFQPADVDSSPNDTLTGAGAVDQQSFSQELRANWEGDQWSWIAGAYYLNDEATDKSAFDILNALRPLFIGDDVNCSAPPGNPTGFCPEQFVIKTKQGTEQKTTSYALFFDASIDLTEKLRLFTGLRYTYEEIEHDSLISFDEPAAGSPPVPGFPDEAYKDFDNVSGRVMLDYRINDDLLLYGGISSGFKAGGIQTNLDGIATYDEETLLSYEAGFKSTLAGGRMRFNGSAFFYDYKDLQVFAFVFVDGVPLSTISNAADAEIYGAEFEFQWLPVENLFLSLGVGLLSSEYKDFLLPSPTGVGTDDFSGNDITMSPELTFNGLVQYSLPLNGNGTLTFQTDFNYQDEVFFDAFNNPLLSEDDYWLWNARVSWTSPDEKWEVAAIGRNLGAEEYMTYAFDLSFLGLNQEILGTPRAFAIELTYRH